MPTPRVDRPHALASKRRPWLLALPAPLAAGRRLENFTRVETFGNNEANGTNDVQWVKVNVDPRSREVFAYEAMIVPANRVAVPAP